METSLRNLSFSTGSASWSHCKHRSGKLLAEGPMANLKERRGGIMKKLVVLMAVMGIPCMVSYAQDANIDAVLGQIHQDVAYLALERTSQGESMSFSSAEVASAFEALSSSERRNAADIVKTFLERRASITPITENAVTQAMEAADKMLQGVVLLTLASGIDVGTEGNLPEDASQKLVTIMKTVGGDYKDVLNNQDRYNALRRALGEEYNLPEYNDFLDNVQQNLKRAKEGEEAETYRRLIEGIGEKGLVAYLGTADGLADF